LALIRDTLALSKTAAKAATPQTLHCVVFLFFFQLSPTPVLPKRGNGVREYCLSIVCSGTLAGVVIAPVQIQIKCSIAVAPCPYVSSQLKQLAEVPKG